jgi:thiamine biosynthesis lipoprotein
MRIGLGIVGLGATAALLVPVQAEANTWRFHADHVLGTSLDLAVVAKRPLAGALAIDAARTEIARLDRILSSWRSDSELTALNAAPSLQVSEDLYAVIAACERMRGITGGAFSARVGRLLQSCDAGMAGRIDTAAVTLDSNTRTITRPRDVVFTVDGLAKGYIVDRALAAARCVPGVDGVMVDIGGDLKCWGAAPIGDHWRIGVADPANPFDNIVPRTQLAVRDQAVATSGISARGLLTVSPQTGNRATHVAQATVLADHAMDADALATAFSVLPPQESLRLADHLPNVAARIVAPDGQVHESARWQSACANLPVRNVQLADAQTPGKWPAGFALNIEYEIPKIVDSIYRNPYVAIWITDENRTLVRSLLLLGKETRYREENYVYWRRFGRLDIAFADSISKPTRAPGQYKLKWDGLDDDGNKVPQGKYILNVEAAREKGGHNVQRIELTLGTDRITAEAKAEGEAGNVRATYGRNL